MTKKLKTIEYRHYERGSRVWYVWAGGLYRGEIIGMDESGDNFTVLRGGPEDGDVVYDTIHVRDVVGYSLEHNGFEMMSPPPDDWDTLTKLREWEVARVAFVEEVDDDSPRRERV